MTVDIKASFGKKEKPRNGLENIIKELVADPMAQRLVIGVVQSPTTKRDNTSGGAQTPVVQFVYIEPMIREDHADAARALFEEAYQARTGNAPDPAPMAQDPLPFDGDEDDDEDDEDDEDEAGF